MRRLLSGALALALASCALNVGGGGEEDLPTAALRASGNASAAAVAETLSAAAPRVALVAGPPDEAWFRSVAEGTGLELSGPALTPDLGLAFLAPEPVGDTTVLLPYAGDTLVVRDALYDLGDRRLLDLLAFQIDDPGTVRDAVTAVLEYVATDVDNAAAVVMAAAVPSPAVGDSLARMFSPGFYDALRCGTGDPPAAARGGLRLFYGPEARIYCRSVTTEETGVGDWVRAALVVGRR